TPGKAHEAQLRLEYDVADSVRHGDSSQSSLVQTTNNIAFSRVTRHPKTATRPGCSGKTCGVRTS
ncbi:MAG: hypothetical protein ACTHKQ_01540, partial [Mesorhizobium sp.]